MRAGVPVKVKIGLKPNGHADYPQWNELPLERERNEDHRNHQIVKWRYDSVGHEEEAADSPVGMQWGMMVVTQTFADEAIAKWPDRVFLMTEAEARDFWENRVYRDAPDERVFGERLAALKAQRDLTVDLGQSTAALDGRISKALDVDDPEPGVTRHPEKSWTRAKTRLGFAIETASR